MKPFKNRNAAGKLLAKKLMAYKGKNTIILAIPRGGVVVGNEIAKSLKLRLDIIVTKKIGYPGNPELAIGAVSLGGKIILDKVIAETHKISKKYIDLEAKEIEREIERRYNEYRGKRPFPDLKNKTVIIADDGIATGYTTLAAIEYVKSKKAKKIIIASPVMPRETFESLKLKADEVVCLHIPDIFFSISQFYGEFGQVSDGEMKRLLNHTAL